MAINEESRIMRFLSRKSKILTAALMGAALVAGGSAMAYWTGSGAGTGTAAVAGSALPIAVNLTAAVTPVLPGNPAQALSGTFTNPNTAPVLVSKLDIKVAPGFTAQADASKRACDASDFAIYGEMGANPPLTIGTLVHTGSTWSGAFLAMNLKPAGNAAVDLVADNQDNCKGVVVPLVFAAS